MSQEQAGAGRRQSATWYELNKGDWRLGVKDEETGAWRDELFSYVYGYYAGHELRQVPARGKAEAHQQLVVTLGGGARPIKAAMYYPSTAARMFASHLGDLKLGDSIQLNAFMGSGGTSACLLVSRHPSDARLARTKFPQDLQDKVSMARDRVNATADGSTERKAAKRTLEDAQEELECWILEEILKTHPGWPGNEAQASEEYDPFAEDEPAPATNTSSPQSLHEASIEAQAPLQRDDPSPSGSAEHTAFGYTFTRWPDAGMWDEPVSEAQVALLGERCQAAGLSALDAELIGLRLQGQFFEGAVPNTSSRGYAAMLISFIGLAPKESLDLALAKPSEAGKEEEFDPFA